MSRVPGSKVIGFSSYKEIGEWLQVMVGGVYFHRTVDTPKPSLLFVYYMAALMDKQLRQ